ncbi:MAG TPA: isochorismatase family protein [Alphaproteobacteria bacterium]|nr:isochorismatase family protein [Alphaproteobacteria bacterium]
MKNLAAIIIDMQEDFLKDISDDRKTLLIDSQLMMIDYFNENNVPVFTCEYGRSCTIEKIKKRLPDFEKNNFKKNESSCFSSQSLVKRLNKLNTKNIFFLGIYGNLCIPSSMSYASSQYDAYTSDDVITCKDIVHKYNPTTNGRKSLLMYTASLYSNVFNKARIHYLENRNQFIELMNSGDKEKPGAGNN